jgi:PilZ domain-containing protein
VSRPTSNRREAVRLAAADGHGIVAIRIRPGHPASVVDVSATGALLETSHRLLPGASVDLHIETRSHRASFRARVVRCTVARVRAAAIAYHGAVAFERHLPWFASLDDGVASDAAQRAAVPPRAPATRAAV